MFKGALSLAVLSLVFVSSAQTNVWWNRSDAGAFTDPSSWYIQGAASRVPTGNDRVWYSSGIPIPGGTLNPAGRDVHFGAFLPTGSSTPFGASQPSESSVHSFADSVWNAHLGTNFVGGAPMAVNGATVNIGVSPNGVTALPNATGDATVNFRGSNGNSHSLSVRLGVRNGSTSGPLPVGTANFSESGQLVRIFQLLAGSQGGRGIVNVTNRATLSVRDMEVKGGASGSESRVNVNSGATLSVNELRAEQGSVINVSGGGTFSYNFLRPIFGTTARVDIAGDGAGTRILAQQNNGSNSWIGMELTNGARFEAAAYGFRNLVIRSGAVAKVDQLNDRFPLLPGTSAGFNVLISGAGSRLETNSNFSGGNPDMVLENGGQMTFKWMSMRGGSIRMDSASGLTGGSATFVAGRVSVGIGGILALGFQSELATIYAPVTVQNGQLSFANGRVEGDVTLDAAKLDFGTTPSVITGNLTVSGSSLFNVPLANLALGTTRSLSVLGTMSGNLTTLTQSGKYWSFRFENHVLTATVVPEPTSVAVLLVGLLALSRRRAS